MQNLTAENRYAGYLPALGLRDDSLWFFYYNITFCYLFSETDHGQETHIITETMKETGALEEVVEEEGLVSLEELCSNPNGT